VAVLKALAHPSRLCITVALMQGERCVGELRELVGDDISTVSKHLLLLRTAGVVACEKRGLNVYYRLACDCFGDFLQLQCHKFILSFEANVIRLRDYLILFMNLFCDLA
jgi:ArsR family transcriptional regulator